MAARHFTARRDARLFAKLTGCTEMLYADGASDAEDRPPYVLAASGLSVFREHLAVIQDDANWLALIDAEQRVHPVPLPPGPNGKRVFTKERGNQGDKLDLEACITVPGENGLELIGFASGSRTGREWILRVRESSAPSEAVEQASPHAASARLDAEFICVKSFYASLREQLDFSGACLNIEGAVATGERIILFQRGNAKPKGRLEPIDATAELPWSELRAYLADPENAPAPVLRNIRCYDLGDLAGVRLTFSDAEDIGDGRILYSASAEHPTSGEIAGSILGVIEADGEARWTELQDTDGATFVGKIEGLTRDVHDRSLIHFVIDDDDASAPSKIYQAQLSGDFFGSSDERLPAPE